MAINRSLKQLVIPISVLLVGIVSAQESSSRLRIEQVMTPSELRDTGVAGLTPQQRQALNAWLNRYTERVISIVGEQEQQPAIAAPHVAGGSCSPAIESTIVGDFNGWEGETVFKLDNGQIWEQAEYSYTYSYSYRPEVTIYQTSSGCRLKVEDEDETILVKQIK
jgi:hypothetical protein